MHENNALIYDIFDNYILRSKIYQDNGKALMSYSNIKLGQWVIKDVLGLGEGELLAYTKLKILGIDSM